MGATNLTPERKIMMFDPVNVLFFIVAGAVVVWFAKKLRSDAAAAEAKRASDAAAAAEVWRLDICNQNGPNFDQAACDARQAQNDQ